MNRIMPIATLCLPRRPTPHLRRIDEQGCPASFANLGAERVHAPALEAPARVDRRRGLPPAAPAIKAIVTISHEPTSPVNLQFRSEPSAVQRRVPIPSRRSRLGTRSKRRPPARGGPSTALCLPGRLDRYSASTLPEAAISSAIFPATLERTFGKRKSDTTATRQRMAVPT